MSKKSKSKDDSPEQMKRKAYEEELRKLQVKLCHLQEWIKQKGLRVIIAFEGRDAAGKGGTIRAITERVKSKSFQDRRAAGTIGAAKEPIVSSAIR